MTRLRMLRRLGAILLMPLAVLAAAEPPPAGPEQQQRFNAALEEKLAVRDADDRLPRAQPLRDGWIVLSSELRHASLAQVHGAAAAGSSRAQNKKLADPVPAITGLAAQLKARGIELIVLPVPTKVSTHPAMLLDGLPSPAPRFDPAGRAFLAELDRQGVTAVDLLPALAAGDPTYGRGHCQQDAHWTAWGTVAAAQRVAALVKDRPWLAEAKAGRPATQAEWVQETFSNGDLRRGVLGEEAPGETLWLRKIGVDGKAAASDPTAPVLLVGDSHTQVFQDGGAFLATRAGLHSQLVHELGVPVWRLSQSGGGAKAGVSLVLALKKDADALAKVKLVIWCFAIRETSETSEGWPQVTLPSSSWSLIDRR